MKLIDLSGRICGRLKVIRRSGGSHGRPTWLCQCACGGLHNLLEVRGDNLRSKHTESCGCLQMELAGRPETHGHSTRSRRTPTYYSWSAMNTRCSNNQHPYYANYGGRGIKVCDRWQKFENFLEDTGERPGGTTLDRYPDNDGNYEPGNCRWATKPEQDNNRRSTYGR